LDLDNLTPGNLPDWLTANDQADKTPAHNDGNASQVVPNWLSELEDGKEADKENEEDDPAISAFADWLSEIDQDNPVTKVEQTTGSLASSAYTPSKEVPDWLQSSSPRATGMLSPKPPTQDTPPSDTGVTPNEALPGWLSELAPPGTSPLGTESDDDAIFNDLAPTKDSVPAWLADMVPPLTEAMPASATPNQPKLVDTLIEDLPTGKTVPDWLADMDEPPASTTTKSSTPEWLTNIVPPLTQDLPATPTLDDLVPDEALGEDVVSDDVPDWLPNTTGETAEKVPMAADEPDWLTGLALSGQLPILDTVQSNLPLVAPIEPSAVAHDKLGDMPDWLREIEATGTLDASVLSQDSNKSIQSGDVPDWLDDLAHTGRLDAVAPTEMPDWLVNIPASKPLDPLPPTPIAVTPPIKSKRVEEKVEHDNLPDWLHEENEGALLDEPVSDLASLPEPEADVALPDWMAGLSAQQGLSEGEETPDWLVEDSAQPPSSDTPGWLAEYSPPEVDIPSPIDSSVDWLADLAAGEEQAEVKEPTD
ncbi:MAG: hypothetical protein KAG66_16585, partial [Methylococcales bacterium]|nr:hypothetical protein [Methylococcales bacterium]